MRIFSRALAVCAMSLAGCAPERDAAMNRFISRGTLARKGTENGDEISYWDGAGPGGELRMVIDLDQQRAYFNRLARRRLPICGEQEFLADVRT